MPDASGNFKGISVPAGAWDRIFGKPRLHPSKWDAKRYGCTCRWWGGGHIAAFGPDCRIAEYHKPRTVMPEVDPA